MGGGKGEERKLYQSESVYVAEACALIRTAGAARKKHQLRRKIIVGVSLLLAAFAFLLIGIEVAQHRLQCVQNKSAASAVNLFPRLNAHPMDFAQGIGENFSRVGGLHWVKHVS